MKIGGEVGKETFGWERYLNQQFYRSKEWKRFRNEIIIRDQGCDMALEDYPIGRGLVLHHINPITAKDILDGSSALLDPENVVCVSSLTHRAIHYSDDSLLPKPIVERTPNDTTLWR